MMKTFNKLAAIVLLISTGQTFAGDSLSANLHTTEPGNLQASAMKIMSADELSAVRGGTFFAPLTPNQVVIAITGFTAQTAGGTDNLNIQTTPLAYTTGGPTDFVVCSTSNQLGGTTLATSQISAGRYANQRLSAADVGLSFGLGVGMPFMSKGCRNSQFAINNQVMLSETVAAAIIDRKQLKRNQTKTPQERQLLTQTWNNEDGWFKWAVTHAETARDNIRQASINADTYDTQSRTCGYSNLSFSDYHKCIAAYQVSIDQQNAIVKTNSQDFKKYTVEAGKAAAQHAKTIGLNYEKIRYENTTYAITN